MSISCRQLAALLQPQCALTSLPSIVAAQASVVDGSARNVSGLRFGREKRCIVGSRAVNTMQLHSLACHCVRHTWMSLPLGLNITLPSGVLLMRLGNEPLLKVLL
jgi:hypothetical protein